MTKFITKDKKVIPIKNGKGKLTSDQVGLNTSDKDLIKAIKGEQRNVINEKYYAEIERRNRQVAQPKHEKVGTVFRDDPNAIEKQQKRVMNFENEQEFWKKIIKFPRRDFRGHNQLGDQRWFALTSASTNLREAKKKLDKLKSDKEKGIILTREPTFKGGKKRFFFKEHQVEG